MCEKTLPNAVRFRFQKTFRKDVCGIEFQAETVEHNFKSRWHIQHIVITVNEK